MVNRIKYGDFQQITPSRSFLKIVDSHAALDAASLTLIRSVLPAVKGIRLVGVTVSNFVPAVQRTELPLFEDTGQGRAAASPVLEAS